MINIIDNDKNIVVCIKPSGALSTDEPGGMPDLIKSTLGDDSEIKTVHRLDRIVSGLMVFAKSTETASSLSRQIQSGVFTKSYLAVIHGIPAKAEGQFDDLLFRDTSKNMTYVVKRMRKGVRDASLKYRVIGLCNDLSLVEIILLTGRTHQIRAQFSSRQMPLVGDKKYGASSDCCQIALWSYRLSFSHPKSGTTMSYEELPPDIYPWNLFPEMTTSRNEYEYELPERKKFRISNQGV